VARPSKIATIAPIPKNAAHLTDMFCRFQKAAMMRTSCRRLTEYLAAIPTIPYEGFGQARKSELKREGQKHEGLRKD